MTRKEFIEILYEEGYSYEIKGDKIVVTANNKFMGNVNLRWIETIPPNVEFRNKGGVDLDSLKTLPPGVEFNNGGGISLDSLETLPSDFQFNNGRIEDGNVILSSIKKIPPGVQFNKYGTVYFNGDYFSEWSGNIEGIEDQRLLNGMIKRGVFL